MSIDPTYFRPNSSIPDCRESRTAGTRHNKEFEDSLARAIETSTDKKGAALAAAEILHLEMLRAAVYLDEPVGPPVSLPASLSSDTNPSSASQFTDTVTNNGKSQAIAPNTPRSNATENVATIDAKEETDGSVLNELLSPEQLTTVKSEPKEDLSAIISEASQKFNVDSRLIVAVIRAESDFNPRAVSPAGAEGLMQLMPATAKMLGVSDPFNPRQNIFAGTRFLKDLLNRYNGDVDKALAAYNWGPGHVDRNTGNLPLETSHYIAKVKRYYREGIG